LNTKEMTMKHSTIVRTLTIAAVTALTLGIASTANAEDKGCSEATLKGTFAYTSTGFIIADAPPSLIGPSAEVGTQTFDGRGNVTFTFNASQNCNTGPGTATGIYKVNDDCTGTFTEALPGFIAHYSFVTDDNLNGFQAICQDVGVVVSRIGRRQFPGIDWRR
jgi:hypothetical protein